MVKEGAIHFRVILSRWSFNSGLETRCSECCVKWGGACDLLLKKLKKAIWEIFFTWSALLNRVYKKFKNSIFVKLSYLDREFIFLLIHFLFFFRILGKNRNFLIVKFKFFNCFIKILLNIPGLNILYKYYFILIYIHKHD